MNRVEIQQVKGKSIVVVDLSHLKPEESLVVIPEAKKLIATQEPKSALVVTDVTKAIYDKAVAEAIKDYAKSNTPYVKASVVVGIDGIQSILLQTAIFITRRDIKTFATRQEAFNWLITQ